MLSGVDVAAPGALVAGYRVVRLLGVGRRSSVWLGHAGPPDDPRIVAIKVYREGVAHSSVEAELRALSAAAHAHVVQLRDLAVGPGQEPHLVLERLSSESLAQLLAVRDELPAGEAVTIIAPVIAAVSALHASGVSHGALTAGHVLFRESGAPVLVGLCSSSAAPADDVESVLLLARTVFARVHTAEAQAFGLWLAEQVAPFGSHFLTALSDRVFTVAEPQPIQLWQAPLAQREAQLIPGRALIAVPHASAAISVSGVSSVNQTANPRHDAVQVPPLVRQLADLVPADVRALIGPSVVTVLRRARGVRRSVWFALIAGVALAAVASALVSADRSSTRAAVPTSVSSVAASSTAPVPVDNSPVAGDDPVDAFGALWAARANCVADLSVLCLDDVDQSGSSAMDDDAALIAAIERGSADGSIVAARPTDVVLVERHGDAALVAFETPNNSEPASVLLLKTEAGWRLRDYVGAPIQGAP